MIKKMLMLVKLCHKIFGTCVNTLDSSTLINKIVTLFFFLIANLHICRPITKMSSNVIFLHLAIKFRSKNQHFMPAKGSVTTGLNFWRLTSTYLYQMSLSRLFISTNKILL